MVENKLRAHRKKELCIAVSGLHGSGKSSLAYALAKKLGLRLVSAGSIFKKMAKEMKKSLKEFSEYAKEDIKVDLLIDDIIRKEAESGSVVLEGHLVGWMTKEKSNLNIFLFAPQSTRLKRIVEREKISVKQAKGIFEIEKAERLRWKKLYGINFEDLSFYDLLINTELLDVNFIVKILQDIINYLKKEWKSEE